MTKTTKPPDVAASLDEWAGNGERDITLPSGTRVRIRLLDVGTHLAYGAVPTELRAAALNDLYRRRSDESLTTAERDDASEKIADANRAIVAAMLVRPALDAEGVKRVPEWDMAMLLEIANRETNRDAAGEPIGVVPLAEFASFRAESGGGPDRDPREGLGSAVPADDE